MNTPLPYRHLSDLSERQLLQVIVDKLCCVAGKYILDIYGGAAAAYSLRSLSKDTIDVVRVRRSVDNAESDFTAREITDGTMTAWVNADMPLPLDTATAAAAYSLRNLKTSYSGSVIRVRRSSDNAEADFTATEITDGTFLAWVNEDVEKIVNGNFATDSDWIKGTGWTISGGAANCDGTQTSSSELKTAVGIAIQGVEVTFSFQVKNYSAGTLNATIEGTGGNEFSGINANGVYSTTATSSDSLPRVTFTASSDFVGSIDNVSVIQTTADGYVTTWYDQAGSNDATQATASSQPKIVDAGVLVEENGKPAVDFDGVDDYMDSLSSITANSIFLVDEGGNGIRFSSNGSQPYIQYGTTPVYRTNVFNPFTSPIAPNTYALQTFIASGASDPRNVSFFANGLAATENPISLDVAVFTKLRIANYLTAYLSFKLQEIILYDSDQSSNRTGIETNINDYYSIYAQDRDGFVTTWYDQSGNGNDATQATAASQPQIVSAGSLITSNGYTVIEYDGTDDNLTTSLTATGTMLMGGSDGSAFYEVAISGGYSLLANASLTDHPLRESIRVIWSSSLTTAQKTAIESLITYTDWDFSDVINFANYWRNRSELTDFPLIDTSSGTTFFAVWFQCTSLTSFPLLDVSNGTSFSNTWRLCTSLTSFPLLDVSSGTSFVNAWRQCISLTSFPTLDLSSGTNFSGAWGYCSSLTIFPANMFDSVTATNFTDAFTSTNLSSQSIENIVVSIDTAGQSNGTLNITGGGNATTATAQTAIDSLTAKGWTVTVPDGYQTYSTYKYRVETDGGTLYASIACTQTAINNLKAL